LIVGPDVILSKRLAAECRHEIGNLATDFPVRPAGEEVFVTRDLPFIRVAVTGDDAVNFGRNGTLTVVLTGDRIDHAMTVRAARMPNGRHHPLEELERRRRRLRAAARGATSGDYRDGEQARLYE
jgi:hypothetical protein